MGTTPPSRSDRAGLLRAFHSLHHGRGHLRLVGFRVWENKPAGAAYYLTADAQGAYVGGATDLFRRVSGHRWAHTTHFRNENPDFNWADTLHPGFLYRATSDGTGAFDEQSTSRFDDGSGTRSDHLHADFAWHFDIDHGRAFLLGADSLFYAPGLTGSDSYAYTDTGDPTQDQSCTGSLKDAAGDQQLAMSIGAYPSTGAKPQGWELTLDLAGNITWPDCGPGNVEPAVARFVGGARMPFSGLGSRFQSPMHATSFDVPLDNSDPEVVKQVEPHESAAGDDGDVASTYTEDLGFAGAVHFRLAGMWMPLGWLSTPQPPVRADKPH